MIYFQKYWLRILTFFLFFILCGCIATVLFGVLALVLKGRALLWVSSIMQNIIWFAVPALAAPVFFCTTPMKYTGITVKPDIRSVIGIIAVFVIAMPALNQVIYYNENMVFPKALEGLEKIMRALEDNAAAATNELLAGGSVSTMLINILVMGVLTGIGEELCFRAGWQRVLMSGGKLNHHAAIWIAATIFSAMHMQIFGFLPRLLLGAFFGYIYYWTGSIWVSAIAHALNNSIVVVMLWAQHLLNLPDDFDKINIGIVSSGIPWIPIASAAVTAFFFLYLRKFFFKKNIKQAKTCG